MGDGRIGSLFTLNRVRSPIRVSRFFRSPLVCRRLPGNPSTVAVGWQVYQDDDRTIDLGYIGLAQFVPGILLFLVSGHAVDRFNRRSILFACYAGFTICPALLFWISAHGVQSIRWIYAVVVLLGIVRAFNFPATRAIIPQIVPEEHLQNAIAWASTAFQSATILGPSIGGVIYAISKGPLAVYATSMALSAAAMLSILGVNPVSKIRPPNQSASRRCSPGCTTSGKRK